MTGLLTQYTINIDSEILNEFLEKTEDKKTSEVIQQLIQQYNEDKIKTDDMTETLQQLEKTIQQQIKTMNKLIKQHNTKKINFGSILKKLGIQTEKIE